MSNQKDKGPETKQQEPKPLPRRHTEQDTPVQPEDGRAGESESSRQQRPKTMAPKKSSKTAESE